MDIARKIINCQTSDELVALENLHVLSDYERGLFFERKAEITSRLVELGIENERQDLSVDFDEFMDTQGTRTVFVGLE